MKVRTKLIIVGMVTILHAIQKGALSQQPLPFPCYEDIKEVGEIFCTITGQHGYMNFMWPQHPKILVILCRDAYLNLSIPFNVTQDQIISNLVLRRPSMATFTSTTMTGYSSTRKLPVIMVGRRRNVYRTCMSSRVAEKV
uniref:Putative salivary secreted protein n=1 Tax=Ixodes ricinus TaxID=34613 RepID=A0A6B0USY8_IXORI